MSDPIAVDVSNLTIEEYQNTDKRVFAMRFTVRKHDGSNPNTVMHAKACDLVAYTEYGYAASSTLIHPHAHTGRRATST